jgi:hypothetical protein
MTLLRTFLLLGGAFMSLVAAAPIGESAVAAREAAPEPNPQNYNRYSDYANGYGSYAPYE